MVNSKQPSPKLSASGSQQLFISSAITMSWQLAISFLVPVLIGVYIDKHFKTSPWFTLVGIMLGVTSSCVIVWRAVRYLNRLAAAQAKEKEEQ